MLLKKYLHHLSELTDLKVFIIRYLVNFVVFLEIVLLPFVLEPSFYSELEFLRYSFLIAPVFLMGAHSGYLFVFYNQKKDYKLAVVMYSFMVALLLAICVSVAFNSLSAGLAIFFVLFTMPLEKILIVKSQLIMASIYKSFISLSLISLCYLIYFIDIKINPIDVFSAGIICGSIIWIAILLAKQDLMPHARLFIQRPIIYIKQFIKLIRYGFIINIQSYILVGYFLFDRFIVNNYFPTYLAEFSLSFSLSQIVFIGINTIAFSAQQRVGHKISNFTGKDYSKSIKLTASIFFVLSLVAYACVYLFSLILKGYGDFFNSFLIVSTLVGGYYLLSSFSVVAFYKGLSMKMLIVLLTFTVINILLSYVFIELGFGYYANLVKSCSLLLLSAIFVDLYTRRVLR